MVGSQATENDVRVVIIDLDGVIRHWPGQDIDDIEHRHGLANGALFAVAFEPSLLQDAVTGRLTDEEWRRAVALELHARHGVDGSDVVAEWSAVPAVLDRAVLEMVVGLRERFRVVLLSNATTRLAADLDMLGVAGVFDLVLSSSELGAAKPDPLCFRRALARVGFHPHQAAFIDDSSANVQAAAAMGMTTHHHSEPLALHRFLEHLCRSAHHRITPVGFRRGNGHNALGTTPAEVWNVRRRLQP